MKIDFSELWDTDSERSLDLIVAFVEAESGRLLTVLEKSPGFQQLTSCQRAKVYAETVPEYPTEALFHLALLGALSKERARRILREAKQVEDVMEQLGL